MKPILTNPSWTDLDKGAQILVQKFVTDTSKLEYPDPFTIVGLARGGLIPAVVISHALENLGYKNKVVPVSYSSKAGNGDGKDHDNVLPVLDTYNVLIVDDIIDGGHTMDEVYRVYHVNHRVKTMALYFKDSSVYHPDYYWECIPADSPWIVFPWE